MDIEHCYVYTYNPKDGSHTKFQLPEHCSTICLTEDPDKLVTTLIKYGRRRTPGSGLWLSVHMSEQTGKCWTLLCTLPLCQCLLRLQDCLMIS